MAESRALLDDVLASLPLSAVLLDESFQIVASSVAFARRFGDAEPNLVGRSLAESWRRAGAIQR